MSASDDREVLVQIRERVSVMSDTVARIEHVLSGNGRPGLVERHIAVEERLAAVEETHEKCPARAAILGGVVKVGGEVQGGGLLAAMSRRDVTVLIIVVLLGLGGGSGIGAAIPSLLKALSAAPAAVP